jgi:hypothetical protein
MYHEYNLSQRIGNSIQTHAQVSRVGHQAMESKWVIDKNSNTWKKGRSQVLYKWEKDNLLDNKMKTYMWLMTGQLNSCRMVERWVTRIKDTYD